MKIFAPGKAVLCGEYAVLEGAPAVSVAVDRGVSAWLAPGTAASPFVSAGIKHALEYIRSRGAKAPAALVRGELTVQIDSSALYLDGAKLGLGSSAAVTVATAATVLASADVSFEDRDALYRQCDEAHAAAQGVRGSGIDVATAVWGGALRFERHTEGVFVRPLDLPSEVQLTFVFTGKSASTAEMLEHVRAWQDRDAEGYRALMSQMRADAQAFISAAEQNDALALVRSAQRYEGLLNHLGEKAGVPIVTREHALLAELALKQGGAGKPSGAGGGDLGVAFTIGERATLALRHDLEAAGLEPLPLAAPARGVHVISEIHREKSNASASPFPMERT
jgi:phosphomevalonate kinase